MGDSSVGDSPDKTVVLSAKGSARVLLSNEKPARPFRNQTNSLHKPSGSMDSTGTIVDKFI